MLQNSSQQYGELDTNLSTNSDKIKWLYIGLIVVLSMLLILSYYLDKNDDINANPINILRVDSNELYTKITRLWPLDTDEIQSLKAYNMEDALRYTIITLDEKVLFSNSKTIDISTTQLLKTALYMDENYKYLNPDMYKLSQVIYINNDIVGFVIFEKVYLTASNNYNLLIINILIFVLIILMIFILGLKIFKKDNRELKAIENGLKNNIKGVYEPIKIKNSAYPKVYHTYNMFIEELEYMINRKELNKGKQKAFLTMISHELKTPIATINAYVEGLLGGIAKDEVTRERYLKIIFDKTKQLTKQVEDFFEYTQESANRFKYRFEECYADTIIEKIFHDIASQSDSHIKYENLLPKCIINIDKMRIEQVIMNLYNNAQKHTTQQDTIILRAYRANDEIILEVEDNGEGISATELPYIFDYYYQGKTSKKKDYSGIGLGLAICKSIIDSHKGRMKVKSQEGIGTTMTVIIPVV